MAESAAVRDLWDEVVGIPLELWMAAESGAELRELMELRDAGLLYPKPQTVGEHRTAHPDHKMYEVMDWGNAEPEAVLCDCGQLFRG